MELKEAAGPVLCLGLSSRRNLCIHPRVCSLSFLSLSLLIITPNPSHSISYPFHSIPYPFHPIATPSHTHTIPVHPISLVSLIDSLLFLCQSWPYHINPLHWCVALLVCQHWSWFKRWVKREKVQQWIQAAGPWQHPGCERRGRPIPALSFAITLRWVFGNVQWTTGKAKLHSSESCQG